MKVKFYCGVYEKAGSGNLLHTSVIFWAIVKLVTLTLMARCRVKPENLVKLSS